MGTLIGSTFRNALCAQFNGVDEYAQVLEPSYLSDTAGYISLWVRFDTVFSGASIQAKSFFAAAEPGATKAFRIGLRRSTQASINNNIELFVGNATNHTFYAATTTTIAAATWYHVVVRYQSGAYAMWINGVSQTVSVWFTNGSGSTPVWFSGLTGTSRYVSVGRGYVINSPSYADCRIDEVLIGTDSIGSTEVKWLYNGGTRRNPHRYPLGHTWYRLGDSRDTGSTIYDEIGSDNLTTVNMDASNYVTP